MRQTFGMFLLILMLFVPLKVSEAEPPVTKQFKPRIEKTVNIKERLRKYIEKQCSKNCVNVNVLYHALEIASEKYKLSKSVILSIVNVESHFDRKAINRGNVGLMQINLKYHKHKFSKDYYDVLDNITIGTSILKGCMKRNKVMNKALKCYNGNSDPEYDKKVLTTLNKMKLIILGT